MKKLFSKCNLDVLFKLHSNKSYFQTIDPSFHSITSPKIRVRIKIKLVTAHEINWVKFKVRGSGIKITISISKIKNISIIEKKWIEKETRELEKGSNPHSKGEFFSRSLILWILKMGIIK